MHNIDSDSEDELPPGWEEKSTEDGNVYFVKYVLNQYNRPFIYTITTLYCYVTQYTFVIVHVITRYNGLIQELAIKRLSQKTCLLDGVKVLMKMVNHYIFTKKPEAKLPLTLG